MSDPYDTSEYYRRGYQDGYDGNKAEDNPTLSPAEAAAYAEGYCDAREANDHRRQMADTEAHERRYKLGPYYVLSAITTRGD